MESESVKDESGLAPPEQMDDNMNPSEFPTHLHGGIRYLEALLDQALSSSSSGDVEVTETMLRYLREVSSALWTVAETGVGRDVEATAMLTPTLLQKLYKWSLRHKYETESKFKAVMDYMICSICYCRPWLFVYLMGLMNLLKIKDSIETSGLKMFEILESWYDDHSIWSKLEPVVLRNSERRIDISTLVTLGRAAQSPTSARILMESPLFESFSSVVSEFCEVYGAVGKTASAAGVRLNINIVTWNQLLDILKLPTTLILMNDFKSWLRDVPDIDVFLPTLKFLSTPASDFQNCFELKEMRAITIQALKSLCWTHLEYQKKVFSALRQVISSEKEMSPFCRKLVEELLFGGEMIYVRIRSGGQIPLKNPRPSHLAIEMHPSLGTDGKDRVFLVSSSSTAREILGTFEGSWTLNLRLDSRPNVQVPAHWTVKNLITASMADQAKSESHQLPFLDILQLSLCKERIQPDQDVESLKAAALPSPLKLFGQDGGLLLLFERDDPLIRAGISPLIIHYFCRFASIPRYSEVLLGNRFYLLTNFIIRLMFGMDKDRGGQGILDSPVMNDLDGLPFRALNELLENHPPSTEEGRNIRKSMVGNRAIGLVLGCMDLFTGNEGDRSNSGSNARGARYGISAAEEAEDDEKKLIRILKILVKFVGVEEEQSDFFPPEVNGIMKNSSLIPVIKIQLKNDSVPNIARRRPLYKLVLQLLRSIAAVPAMRSLLTSTDGGAIISELLAKMRNTVIIYSHLLMLHSDAEDLDLNEFVKEIEVTTGKIEEAVKKLVDVKEENPMVEVKEEEEEAKMEEEVEIGDGDAGRLSRVVPAPMKSPNERYVNELRNLQFAFVEMIGEGQVFHVPYHFQAEARKVWAKSKEMLNFRAKRLAQESATLFSSLPLSYRSSIFIRCDSRRLDVLKVLFTGPVEGPYCNGCFEVDIFLPMDYPMSPPEVQFEVNDGKTVQFSKRHWDPKTSCLLSVLDATQAYISEEEEYSPQHNAYIRYWTLKEAILDKIRNPPACWKEVMHRHFWLKREEIIQQCEEWKMVARDLDWRDCKEFKQTLNDLKTKLLEMSPPEGLELDESEKKEYKVQCVLQ